MKTICQSKYGIVLTEALVAVATLSMGVMVLGVLINNGISTLKVSKDYLIAQNLLIEGAEMVKSVRSSNWLIVPSKNECWRTLDPITNLNREINQINCNASNMEADDNFIPVFENRHWLLKNSGVGELDLDTQNAENGIQNKYRILFRQIGDFKGYFQGINSNEKSKYYRSIAFLQPTNADQVSFEVKVQWLDGKKARKITKRGVLKNWL